MNLILISNTKAKAASLLKCSILYFFVAIFLILSSCQYIEKRRHQENTPEENSNFNGQREANNKQRIRELEKRLLTKQEKQMYSRLLPWFQDDEEKIAFLSQSSFEARQSWAQQSGILNRQAQLNSKYKKLIENQDIAIGMPNDLVKKSWGDPLQIEVSGNPLFKNEKWRYSRSVSSSEGFRQEKRIVYFENGKVVGWETE